MNFSNGKAFFTEHAIAVQANEKNDTLFLYYKLGLMNLGQYSGQSAQPGLSVNKLTALEIFIPEKAEQTAISNYFQKLDALINQHQQQITKLNNIKQSCLSKMFV
ncbi:Type I restriction modification DNA specificity domain protein [compost metagenome]